MKQLTSYNRVHYRIDRMKNVELMGEARDGADEFKMLDFEAYLNEHFSMFHGDKEHVMLRADNGLLDTFVDRFGIRNALYAKDGEEHFTIRVSVSVSEQFFGWICGFGKRVKILSPQQLADSFKAYLDSMLNLYNDSSSKDDI